MKRALTIFLIVLLALPLMSAGRPQVVARIDDAAEQLSLMEAFFRGRSRALCGDAYDAVTKAFRKRLTKDGITLNPAERRHWEKVIKPIFGLNGSSRKKPPFNGRK